MTVFIHSTSNKSGSSSSRSVQKVQYDPEITKLLRERILSTWEYNIKMNPVKIGFGCGLDSSGSG